MIQREHYLSKIRPFYDSDLIKIITGIRRCGKSVIMDQIAEECQNRGFPVLKLNFEQRAVSKEITNADELIAAVMQHIGKDKLYVFLDEVQMIPNWNIACRSLRLENISLFITGSNSELLSREFTKELSGRYVSFRIRPFVYAELQTYAWELQKTVSITDYLLYGGFPKIVEFDTREAKLQYLNDLDETIVVNDIMNRYQIRKKQLFRRLTDFVLLSNARVFSANSIRNYLLGQNIQCSLNTIKKYLAYLEEAYVVGKLTQYSTRAKRTLNYFEKLYDEDVSMNTIRQTGNRTDLTHNLENVVYNELLYRGYDLSVYREEGREIDFLAEKNGKQYLVQVAYSIAEESTYQREFALFDKLDQSRKKIIITMDEADFSTSTVEHIPVSRFLLYDQLS